MDEMTILGCVLRINVREFDMLGWRGEGPNGRPLSARYYSESGRWQVALDLSFCTTHSAYAYGATAYEAAANLETELRRIIDGAATALGCLTKKREAA